jgi:hypothetical protein
MCHDTTYSDTRLTVLQTWSYRAKNSTLRAIQHAGFNKLNFPNLQRFLLVTEPEAAAIYTAQYLKQQEAELLKVCKKAVTARILLTFMPGERMLRSLRCRRWNSGMCDFVCLHSIGINISQDVVTYKVMQVEPNLQLEALTIPTGRTNQYERESSKR